MAASEKVKVTLRLQWSMRTQLILWMISGILSVNLIKTGYQWFQEQRAAENRRSEKPVQRVLRSNPNDSILFTVFGDEDKEVFIGDHEIKINEATN